MTYTIYVIALLITLTGFLFNVVCCCIDFQTYKKLQKRVKALEDKK